MVSYQQNLNSIKILVWVNSIKVRIMITSVIYIINISFLSILLYLLEPGKLGLMPSTTTLEAVSVRIFNIIYYSYYQELIQVKQKLNESKLIIKRISVDNLKLEEENKKISNLMEKVIQSYNPESHSHFIENGNKNNNNGKI